MTPITILDLIAKPHLNQPTNQPTNQSKQQVSSAPEHWLLFSPLFEFSSHRQNQLFSLLSKWFPPHEVLIEIWHIIHAVHSAFQLMALYVIK